MVQWQCSVSDMSKWGSRLKGKLNAVKGPTLAKRKLFFLTSAVTVDFMVSTGLVALQCYIRHKNYQSWRGGLALFDTLQQC